MSDVNESMTWMVVEDDHAIRDVIKTMCELWGFQVVAFKDGFEAQKYLQEAAVADPVPDIALLDIRMPGPWGHEIAAMIRKHPVLKDIGVVLMTAYALPGADEDAYMETSGADRLIFKPLPSMNDLRQLMLDVRSSRREKLAPADGTGEKPASAEAPEEAAAKQEPANAADARAKDEDTQPKAALAASGTANHNSTPGEDKSKAGKPEADKPAGDRPAEIAAKAGEKTAAETVKTEGTEEKPAGKPAGKLAKKDDSPAEGKTEPAKKPTKGESKRGSYKPNGPKAEQPKPPDKPEKQ